MRDLEESLLHYTKKCGPYSEVLRELRYNRNTVFSFVIKEVDSYCSVEKRLHVPKIKEERHYKAFVII